MKSHKTLFALFFLALSEPAWCQLPSFTISTIAGKPPNSGHSGDGGLATSALLDEPRGIVSDPAGNVYFCDFGNNVVRKIATDGTITTVAGTGNPGYNGDNIPGPQAELWEPWRVAMDPAGNLYIADAGNARIRKLAPNGIITTVAGNGQPGYKGDGGPATSASLRVPEDAVVDAFGNMYIADAGNNVIRKVNASGIISTIAGTGYGAGTGNTTGNGDFAGDGGPAIKADLNLPVSIAVDPAGNIFISDQLNNVIRKVNTSGIISTVAGISTQFGYAGDGGPATLAVFGYPAGVALDTAGNLYIVDVNNDMIRVMLTNGSMQRLAGNGSAGYGGDGGPATAAKLNAPRSVAVGTFGDVYIADFSNNAVRQLTPSSTTLGQMTNAFGNVRIFAPNTWITIKGTDLAPSGDSRVWQASDFVNGQLPTSLDGVSVTINGVSAYIYYISPTQVNALAPPGLEAGIGQVQVTNNGTKSAPGSVVVQAYSPTFFEFGAGPYVTAVHLNGSIIGPTSLYPGFSTPAQSGETIVLFANGFGATSVPVTGGSSQQTGNLPSLPTVTIGGAVANVTFAGLISPGLYQFNVQVPSSAANGDSTLTASYNGLITQAGVLLTVQH